MANVKGTPHKPDNGHKEGGLKAAVTNKLRDPDFYKKIGAKGGRNGGPGRGFALNPDLAKVAGAKGGKISKRGPDKMREVL